MDRSAGTKAPQPPSSTAAGPASPDLKKAALPRTVLGFIKLIPLAYPLGRCFWHLFRPPAAAVEPDFPEQLVTDGILSASHTSILAETGCLDDPDRLYCRFEEAFRGAPAEVRKKQTVYLPYVKQARRNSAGHCFLDIGCGRGEFLGLLKDNGIPAQGLDQNRLSSEALKTQGYDVVRSEALAFLRAQPDDHYLGFSLFQVIEHLDLSSLKDLFRSCWDKTAELGCLIVESVNPYCPLALGEFYLDPTHLRPYPADLVKFLLACQGYAELKIVYSSPVAPELRSAYPPGNYRDYAVIGRKPPAKRTAGG